MSLPAPEVQSPGATARVAVMSIRNTEDHVAKASGYELEDMICEEFDFARLVAPGPFPDKRSAWAQRLQVQAATKFGRNGLARSLSSSSRTVRLDQDYDLFFFNAAAVRNLVELEHVSNWRERSKFAVCWLQELWAANITPENKLLDLLEQFDHVFCPFHHSVEPLRQRISTPVSYLPWGIDALKFCPYPDPPRRVIEVAGIGAIPEATERALIRHADETGSFFHYQTVFGPSKIRSHRAHRHNYAGILQRSEFFLSYMAKFSNSDRDRQEEFGLRYIEGVAAGSILLGDPIDNPAFHKYLGWTDSVIPLDVADPAPERLIRELRAQPDRIAAARHRNIVNSLRTLDNVYRWKDVLQIAGLPETPAMQQRQNHLAALADSIATDADMAPGDVALG